VPATQPPRNSPHERKRISDSPKDPSTRSTDPAGSPAASVTRHSPTRSEGTPPAPDGAADTGLALGLATGLGLAALGFADEHAQTSNTAATVEHHLTLPVRTRM
jgi:hypothetical protein